MRIYALMENTPYRCGFAAEHGLSLYIETERHTILFDTGQSEAFAQNAQALGLDLNRVDLAVLSHGHYDHGGGLRRFLACNDHAPVYVSDRAFGVYYRGMERYIGIDPTLDGNDRLLRVTGTLDIDDTLTLCTCNDRVRRYPTDDAGLREKRDGAFVPDAFLHEQYLIIRENGRRIVISGCSHKGVLNIMDWLHPDVLVGGFHFMKQVVTPDGNAVLDEAARVLSGYDTDYYTCHCTGEQQYAYLKARMGERLHYLASGQCIEL